ncbi:MAG: TetR/AcrR family transcriptional regulator [Lachnospiraceae bacterium]
MRSRKDPGIRREAFVQAARTLFLKRGYESVSVRDVLDAVDERSASPSVFYYYFASKSDLYRACLEETAARYLEGLREAFSKAGTPQGQLTALAQGMRAGLASSSGLLLAGGGADQNRAVILDLRDQVTRGIGAMWEDFLHRRGLPEEEAGPLSKFLAGGIGELVYEFLLGTDTGEASQEKLLCEISELVLRTLGISRDAAADFIQKGEETPHGNPEGEH